MQLARGNRLHHYTLDRQIGIGGMSTVWAAVDARTGAKVALKLMLSTNSLDVARVRVLREAQASQRVAHPAIVPVMDVFSHDENPVLVMELLRGETLRLVLQREQPLPLERAARLLLPIAEALHQAHGAGIVHRDLKPENIFIEEPIEGHTTTNVNVRLLDFGVARDYEPRHGIEQTPITELGSLLGTLAYMAPEQALHPSECDLRVDIWAFGVTLYEALSGCRPIEGNTAAETMRQLLVGGITPLKVVQPDLPEDVTDLVDSMLTRRAERRLATLEPVISILRKRV
jgi:eukaryotic-like serine/threonine-protein kinase